jgi:8-oxo-dGTP pyrophosphatase MutT (NUDIX family)
VLREEAGDWLFLLLRAFRSWDFPKGMVEPGEEPLAAAKREVREESTIADLDFRFGEKFIETGPYSRNKVARYYIAATRTVDVTLPVNPALGFAEHHEWRWVDFAAAMNLVSLRVAPVVDWAREILHAGR